MNVLDIYTIMTSGIFVFIIIQDTFLENRVKRLFLISISITALLLVVNHIQQEADFSRVRSVSTAIGYSLKIVLLYILFKIFVRGSAIKNLLWGIPAFLCIVLCFLSIRYNLVFSVDESNVFFRGPLNFIPFSVAIFYLICITVFSIRVFSHYRLHELIMGLIILTEGILSFVLETVLKAKNLLALTMPASLTFYYIYLYMMRTKTDEMTGVLNRFSSIMDLKRVAGYRSCGIISIDMNNLKEINDNYGHLAGDKYICSLANYLKNNLPRKAKIYRVGGDEFLIFWKNPKENEIDEKVRLMKTDLKELNISVAIGYYIHDDKVISIEEAVSKADFNMYADKKRKVN